MLTGNKAVGATGGVNGSGEYDLSGKGGDAQGGAVYLNSGGLIVNQSTITSNVVDAGNDGAGDFGVVAAEPAQSGSPPTPTLDSSRTGLAQGGAVFVNSGTVSITGAAIAENSATGDSAPSYQGFVTGAVGGAAQGGALYLANPSSTVTISSTDFTNNSANGGTGSLVVSGNTEATGGAGGEADGGAIYLGAGSLTLSSDLLGANGAYGGLGGGAVSGFGGTSGAAYGGAVYALGNVTLTTTVIANNNAWGGTFESLSAAAGVGDGDFGGGSGGAGGDAYGGGLYLGGGSLASNYSVFELNTAFGGNGGVGFDALTLLNDGGGTPGGSGGRGGDAYGGGVYSASIGATISMTFSAFRQNLVLGGSGGRAGNGEGSGRQRKRQWRSRW